jgi:hypothetical protein
VFSDPVSVVAALAGVVVAVAVVVRFGWWRAPTDPVPPSRPRYVATEYATRHAPSAAPILTALGGALLAIGLVFVGHSLAVAIGPLIAGGLFIGAAVVSVLRGHGRAAADASDGSEAGDREGPN